MSKKPLCVCVSGAAGQIGYSFLPLVCSGRVFGPDQPIVLHLLDIERQMKVLNGVVMEIRDCAYPLVQKIVATFDVKEAFTGVQVACLIGGFPRLKGMLRKDLLAKNLPIFKSQGEALDKYADKNVKVVVVANPANTNCLVAATYAPSIPKSNFSALTRLDYNRAKGQIAKKLNVTSDKVKNVAIWGNHSKTQYPDASRATVELDGKVKAVTDALDQKYLESEFITTVQQRGAAVISARGFSSAMSAANAVGDHLKSWFHGTPKGENVAMAVYSNGEYGVAKGIVYSFPVTCENGNYKIVEGIKLSDKAKEHLKASEKELLAEKGEALK